MFNTPKKHLSLAKRASGFEFGLRPPFWGLLFDTPTRDAVTSRHASVSAKASPSQVGFLAFWGRFASGRAVAGLASARVGVALAKSPAMPRIA